MTASKKAIVSIVLVIGALGLGAAASALDGTTSAPIVEEPTTTTVEEPTTSEVPTSAEPATTEPTTTVEQPLTTEAPVTTEAPTTTATPEVAANAFGHCNAFSGRAQPGNSQAWQRLHDTAGGDIEGYCAEILGARSEDEVDDDADDGRVEQPASRQTVEAEPRPRGGTPNGHNGKGNGKGTGGGSVRSGR